MAGILDGAFGGGGTGILPDWLFNPNGWPTLGRT